MNFDKIYNFFHYIKTNIAANILYVASFLFVKIYLLVFLIFNILAWVFSVYIYNQVSHNLVVLHYNVNFGIDLVGDRSQLFVLPILGIVIMLVNFILLTVFSKSSHFKFLGHLLFLAAILSNLFLLVSLGSVYLINFR